MVERLRRAVKKPAFWGVLIFLVLLVWGQLREAHADSLDAVIGVGAGSTHDSELMIQEVTLEFDRKWDLTISHLAGDPRVESTYAASASRRFSWRETEDFSPFVAFGVTYFERAPAAFVSEELTYFLALGVRWRGLLELGWVHNSTAGRAYNNYGLDYVALRAVLPIKHF